MGIRAKLEGLCSSIDTTRMEAKHILKMKPSLYGQARPMYEAKPAKVRSTVRAKIMWIVNSAKTIKKVVLFVARSDIAPMVKGIHCQAIRDRVKDAAR